jgi:hypothetical protein
MLFFDSSARATNVASKTLVAIVRSLMMISWFFYLSPSNAKTCLPFSFDSLGKVVLLSRVQDLPYRIDYIFLSYLDWSNHNCYIICECANVMGTSLQMHFLITRHW